MPCTFLSAWHLYYDNPDIGNVQRLIAASQALQSAEILVADFEEAVALARAGDLVYFDPPYVSLNATSKQAQVFLGRPDTIATASPRPIKSD